MIDTGELRDVVEMQDFTTITNENGFQTKDYTTIYRLRAKVKTQGTKEYMSASRDTTKLTIHVICPKRKGIDSDKFLLYNSKRYNVKHVHELEDRMFLQLTCEVID